jgi:PhzF family phenazine biosynthesis protein
MDIPLYVVDAFTDKPFQGNPAAVCPLNAWLDDDLMQAIAAENNLSETAFLVPAGDSYELRWFTPKVEVDQPEQTSGFPLPDQKRRTDRQ